MDRYFPAFCARCAGAVLVENPDQSREVGLRCPSCGEPAQLIPGAYYQAKDCGRFEASARVIRDAALSPSQLTLILLELERVARKAELLRASVAAVLEKTSGLWALQAVLPRDELELRRALGMLVTILNAFSHAEPRGSGVHRTAFAELAAEDAPGGADEAAHRGSSEAAPGDAASS